MSSCACQEHAPKTSRERRSYWLALWLTILIFFVELGFGLWGNCLSLVADAWHVLVDAGALAVAIIVARSVERAHETDEKSIRLMGVYIQGALLLVACWWMIKEAILRLQAPHVEHLGILFVVTILGGVGNWGQHRIILGGKQAANHTQHMMRLHILTDLGESVCVAIGIVCIYFFGWHIIDPILTIVFAGLMLLALAKSTWLAVRDALPRPGPVPQECEHHDCGHDHR